MRPPWKNDTIQIPGNRAIAFTKLLSVWNSHQKNLQLLEQYNEDFQEQLRQIIIKELDEEKPTSGQMLSYISNQAVLTPNKTTTKLRIVLEPAASTRILLLQIRLSTINGT